MEETHERLTLKSFELFEKESAIEFTDSIFKGPTLETLSFAGVPNRLTGFPLALSISEWMALGANHEDRHTGLTGRFFKHFYNTTATGDKGLTVEGRTNESSLEWAESTDNVLSAPNALQAYNEALSASGDPDVREMKFAQYYYSVGAIAHLVQDIGNPAHTRNDKHPANNGAAGKPPHAIISGVKTL